MTENVKSNSSSNQRVTGGKPPKREPSPLTKILPTDRLAFDKQGEIARAFVAVFEANGGKPVSNEQAGAALTPALAANTVLTTNPFFSDIGLLIREDGGGFVPSQPLLEYTKARQFDEAAAREKLRPLFEKTWFHRCLAPKLRLSSQTKANCLAMLAGESNASSEYMERLTNLISFLALAGLLSINGDTVSLLSHGQPVKTPPSPLNDPLSETNRNGIGESSQKKSDSLAHTYVLPLDRENKRVVSVTAPLDVKENEVKRIQKWLEVTLLMDWHEDTDKPTA